MRLSSTSERNCCLATTKAAAETRTTATATATAATTEILVLSFTATSDIVYESSRNV
jgi:hypothetical protein